MSDDYMKCVNCGQPKVAAKPGRLTQWLSVCQCSAVVDESILDDRVSICSICERRIDSGRSGSLTQWVFRPETCQCERPVPVQLQSGGGNLEPADVANQPTEKEPMNLADLDTSRFPIHRYKPFQRIGSGGSGAVYLCWDEHLQMRVAVKVLLDAHPSMQVMFQKEAKVTAKLEHPNVVRIIDFGSINATPYMVLEYVVGTSLSDFLAANGPLNNYSFVRLFLEVTDALGFAHREGIFHRDIKSSNILLKVDDAGTVKPYIIDFGVAAWIRGNQSATVQGMTLVGTPQYMPPDQAMGNVFDARSEIYSLGCLMFETLSGRLPFQGDDPLTLISQHATEPAPFLSDIAPDVPEELAALVASCLAKSPDQRFQSMAELKVALSELEIEPPAAVESTEENAPVAVAHSPMKKSTIIAIFTSIVILSGFSIAFATQYMFPTVKPEQKKKMRKKRRQMLKRELAVSTFDEGIEEAAHGKKFEESPRAGNAGLHVVADSLVDDDDLQSLKGRQDITSLRLHGANISARGLEALVDLPLDSLDLSSCSIKDDDLAVVGRMKNLLTLSLSECNDITAVGLVNLVGLKVTTLQLRNTSIDDNGAAVCSKISSLMQLMISDTKVTADGLKSIGKLERLNLLEIDPDDKPVEFFKELGHTHASYLAMDSRNSKSIPPECLESVGSPKTIMLKHVRLNSETVRALAKVKGLQALHISNTNITDELLAEVGRLQLQSLTVEHEMITERGVVGLLKTTKIETISFPTCINISPSSIEGFRKIRTDLTIN
ncbi:MAG: serine/threonine protein kinase [Cyanobacteria bacterium]|nr:serine/threonine protein kinase [Cyanobacteriota bacterium]